MVLVLVPVLVLTVVVVVVVVVGARLWLVWRSKSNHRLDHVIGDATGQKVYIKTGPKNEGAPGHAQCVP